MNRELVRKVADSVLYEGYMLYPYRPSAIKNRQRWSFGILYPADYAEVVKGTERSRMHSECLVQGKAEASIQIELRFLHLRARQVFRPANGRFEALPSLSVDGRLIESWDEATERSASFQLSLNTATQDFAFNFAGTSESEFLRDSSGKVAGRMSYTQQQIQGTVSARAEGILDGIWKLSIDAFNTTPLAGGARDRNAALIGSLLSTQMLLIAAGAEFVSLLDPPEDLRAAVAACSNIGNFPVLLGCAGEHEMMLCSPILLYDYPQIAPESAADFYDGTEIDEMLTLRVMTLTDQEKSEMRGADDHVRTLLERTEASAREHLMSTHGAIRSLRHVSEVREKSR